MAKQPRLAKARPYTLRRRAAAMERTRGRITMAAIELHETVGPAATTMTSVAERAGVTRATLYRHFGDEAALFAACSAEWLAGHPRPDPAALPADIDRTANLSVALDAVYAWYRENAKMRANLLRDVDVFPPVIAAGIRSFPAGFVDALDASWPSPGSGPGPPGRSAPRDRERARRERRAAIALALSFDTWRQLTDLGLDDAEARDLMVRLVGSIDASRK